MNQAEEIAKLFVKVKEYKIPKNPKPGQDQATIGITPLSLEDISLYDLKEGTPIEEAAKKTVGMLARSLSVTEEEVKKVSFEFLQELVDCVTDANNMTDEQKGKLERIKEKLMRDAVKPSGSA